MSENSRRAQRAGFWIVTLAVVLVVGTFGSYGDAYTTIGRMIETGLASARERRPLVRVEVEGWTALVSVPAARGCRVAQGISLVIVRTLVFRRYRTADRVDPCSAMPEG